MEQAHKKRALTIAVIVAVVFAAYFLRNYFTVIAFAAITAYMLNPLYEWLNKRLKRSSVAAGLTFLACLCIIIIPLVIISFLTVLQAQNIIHDVRTGGLDIHSVSRFGQRLLDDANRVLAHFPGDYHVTQQTITSKASSLVGSAAQGLLTFLRNSAGGIAGFFVSLILYIYLFVNMLMHQKALIDVIRHINPLGERVSNDYLQKMGKMTTAMVRGQFVVAVAQGFVGAVILAIAGMPQIFFFMFMILSALSIIPLGGGIVAIPIGVVMLFTGHVWQGIVILLGHFLIVSNIDNIIRPRLVPHSIHLNSALTLVSVFAGVGMFGFLGIVIGPVLMILIVSTIQMYLSSHGDSQALFEQDPAPKKS